MRTDAIVVGIDEDGVVVKPSERISAETVLWAAGVAASPLAKSLGVPLDRVGTGHARADALRSRRIPNIYVVGDLCAFTQDGKMLPGVAQVAIQQGTQAGRNVLRALEGRPLQPFRYRDYGIMATIGRDSAVGEVFGLKISGFSAWIFWIVPAHRLADRLPQPVRRDDRVGVGLLLAAAPGAVDHRRVGRGVTTFSPVRSASVTTIGGGGAAPVLELLEKLTLPIPPDPPAVIIGMAWTR